MKPEENTAVEINTKIEQVLTKTIGVRLLSSLDHPLLVTLASIPSAEGYTLLLHEDTAEVREAFDSNAVSYYPLSNSMEVTVKMTDTLSSSASWKAIPVTQEELEAPSSLPLSPSAPKLVSSKKGKRR
jgi:hypothetical protein